MKFTRSPFFIPLLAAAAVFAGMLGYVTFFQFPAQSLKTQALGGDFTINTAKGPFKLADHRNKIVVLYFGFANCPDVCPTALAMTTAVLKTLSEEQQAQIQPVFISVDPERDTLDNLQQYGQYFYPRLISGTDSKENIDALVKRYGAYYRITQQAESAMGYTVDHTSRLYIIDKQGKFADTVSHGSITTELATKLAPHLQ